MGRQKKIEINDNDKLDQSVSGLRDLYFQTLEETLRCAKIKPGEISDTEHDLREGVLLDFEAHLLDIASKIPLRNEQDMTTLMEIWATSAGVPTGDIRPSDKIVMNIFRHLSQG